MIQPSSPWRLILSSPASGSWNMALDEAILESASEGHSLPTLRLYAWQPACLSLGHTQPVADADLTALQSRGWELVRRPTGGKAILHVDELTYSVTGPKESCLLSGGVLDSYQRIAQALLAALRFLGLLAEARAKPLASAGQLSTKAGSHTDAQNPVCFEAPSNYEITVGGKKLIGSAQRRTVKGVLQHGSLPLTGDLTRILQGLFFPDAAAREVAARRLLERALTLESALGRRVAWQEAAAVFSRAFSETLGLTLHEDDPNGWEIQQASRLEVEKYRATAWTNRV